MKITLRVVGLLHEYYSEKLLELEHLAELESEPQDVERVPAEISHVNVVPVVVLHIGESARADHAPFNGYGRNTMPNMLREYEAGNLISFPKCVSFANYTIYSMRGIMTPSTVLDNAFRHPTFIPALSQSGVEVCGFWSGVKPRNDVWDTSVGQLFKKMPTLICSDALAVSLLPNIREKLSEDAKEEPLQERFYLYYGEGSHVPFTFYDYDRHAVFKPNGKRKYGDERDVNNYDNTFVATDEFCEGFIDALRDENAVYIFVGDHGEMLGEDGLQGRPFKRKETRHVLFFIWASDKFKAENPELWATLVRNRERLGVVSHDFVYSSVLHLFSLRTPFYDEKADLFSDSAESFPTEMPEAEEFGPMRFGEIYVEAPK